MSNNIIEASIGEYAERSYLEYAMSVVKGRAIPSVEDGLKPVHRRILYVMYELGMLASSVPKKSAKVVGSVIGGYHPHGDVAVYEAMVRQAQPFSLRYPIVEGVGNFGSRDGDGAASMRYTEAKLQPIANAFIDELNDHCIEFFPTYDNSMVEPQFLPARLPFILLNGNPGIGVGIATNIPSHNLNEVVNATIALVKNENISIEGLMEYIKGPDFPTAAQIISSKEEIIKMYSEGRGSVRLRSKYIIENEGTKNWQLVFTEIPYEKSAKTIMEQVYALLNPEPKEKNGKKLFTPEQTKSKLLFQSVIDKYNDESDRNNPIRIVFKPKSYKQNPQEMISLLMASTDLECNFNANFVAVGRDGIPCQKNLKAILLEWIDFRLETIAKRVNYHLEKINHRMHLLEGRKIIHTNLSKVIELIQRSENPKEDLMSEFGLSEIQAQDALDMRLRQLNKLEISEIEKEYTNLDKEKKKLEKIISTPNNLKLQLVKELEEDVKKYGDVRRTEIKQEDRVDVSIIAERMAIVSEEKITLAISKKGWVKTRIGEKTKDDFIFKDGDDLDFIFQCKNTDVLCILDSSGKAYNYNLGSIPKEGTPMNTLVSLTGKYEIAFPINKNFKYVLSHSQGLGFIATGESLMTKLKSGKSVFSLPPGAHFLQPLYFENNENGENLRAALLTEDSRVLVLNLNEIPEIVRGKGVGLINCKSGQLTEIMMVKDAVVKILVSADGANSELNFSGSELEKLIQNRAASAKGKSLLPKKKIATTSFIRQ